MIIGRETLVCQSQNLDAEGEEEWAHVDEGRALTRITLPSQDVNRAVQFYTTYFGMKMRVPLDLPEAPRAALYATESSSFCLELMDSDTFAKCRGESGSPENGFMFSDQQKKKTQDGEEGEREGFSHFTLIVPSTRKVLESLKSNGYGSLIIDPQAAVTAVRSKSDEGGQTRVDITAIVRDLDGYVWRIEEIRSIENEPKEALATVAFHVRNVKSSLDWWISQGATLQQDYEVMHNGKNDGSPYICALCGWGDELIVPQLELKEVCPCQREIPHSFQRNHFRLVVGTADLERTAKSLAYYMEESIENYKKVEISSLERAQGTVTAIKVITPDAWEVYFSQNDI